MNAILFFVFIAFVVLLVVGVKVQASKQQEQKSKNNTVNRPKRVQQKSTEVCTHEDGSKHTHYGNVVETYEPIVGSLGEVHDEGCDDLDDIRMILLDEIYRGDDGMLQLSPIAKAMLLGELFNEPRFDAPPDGKHFDE